MSGALITTVGSLETADVVPELPCVVCVYPEVILYNEPPLPTVTPVIAPFKNALPVAPTP